MNTKNKISPEIELLICCSRTNVGSKIKDKILDLVGTDLDWDYLLRIATEHKLKSLLFHNLNSICPEKIPKNILRDLKNHFNNNARKNLFLMGELIKIVEIFRLNEINIIPYKGPTLAILAYHNLAFRDFRDLDILINSKDFLAVNNQLIKLGYNSRINFNVIHCNSFMKLYLKSNREFLYEHLEKNVIIEVHWKIQPLFYSFSSSKFKQLYNNLIAVPINGANLMTMSINDNLLLLCMHASGHLWDRLSWSCDILEIIQGNDIEWDCLLVKAKKLGIYRIVLINLVILNELFDMKFPYIIMENIKSDKMSIILKNKIINSYFDGKPEKSISNKVYLRFNSRENKSDGFKDLIRLLIITIYNLLKNLFKYF